MKTNKMQIEMASKQEVSDWQWRIIENLRESHAGIIIKWGAFPLECYWIFFWFFLLQELISVSFTNKKKSG